MKHIKTTVKFVLAALAVIAAGVGLASVPRVRALVIRNN